MEHNQLEASLFSKKTRYPGCYTFVMSHMFKYIFSTVPLPGSLTIRPTGWTISMSKTWDTLK